MRILILEDDHLMVADIREAIERRFPDAEIIVCPTELDFHRRIAESGFRPPDLAILDVMVKWTDPEEGMIMPDMSGEGAGPWRAGFRCAQMLRARWPLLPIVFYSVLEIEDVDRDLAAINGAGGGPIGFLGKLADPDNLLKEIEEKLLLTGRPR